MSSVSIDGAIPPAGTTVVRVDDDSDNQTMPQHQQPATGAPAAASSDANDQHETDSVVDGEPLTLADAVYNAAGFGRSGARAGDDDDDDGDEGVPPQSEEEAYMEHQQQLAERYGAIGWTTVLLVFLSYQLPSESGGLGDDTPSTSPTGGASSPSSSNEGNSSFWDSFLNSTRHRPSSYKDGGYTYTHSDAHQQGAASHSRVDFVVTPSYERLVLDRAYLKYIFVASLLLLLLLIVRRGLRATCSPRRRGGVPFWGCLRAFSTSYLAAFWIIVPMATIVAAVLIGLFSVFVPAGTIHTERETTHFGGGAGAAAAPSDEKIDKVRELFGVAAQVFGFVLCSEVAKMHYFETAFARARLRTPSHYGYYAAAVALGFASLESVVAASFDRVYTSFLATIYDSDFAVNPKSAAVLTRERSRAQLAWWIGFTACAAAANLLTSYLIAMSLARRDLRIIGNIETNAVRSAVAAASAATSAATTAANGDAAAMRRQRRQRRLRRDRQQSAATGDGAPTPAQGEEQQQQQQQHQEASTTAAAAAENQQAVAQDNTAEVVLTDEHKPVRRPFLLSVLFRSLLLCFLGIMMDRFFYVFPQRVEDSAQNRLSAWPLAGVVICPTVALFMLAAFTVYVLVYERIMLPASYLKVTGSIGDIVRPLDSSTCCLAVWLGDWYAARQQGGNNSNSSSSSSLAVIHGGGAAAVAAAALTATALQQHTSGGGGGIARLQASGAPAAAASDTEMTAAASRRVVAVGAVVAADAVGRAAPATTNNNGSNVAGAGDDDEEEEEEDELSDASSSDDEQRGETASLTRAERRAQRRAQEEQRRREERRRQFPDLQFIVSERPRGYAASTAVGDRV
jgi:hypothetical protein